MQLAEKGDLALLENLVRKSPEVLGEKDECGASPLHHAAAGGHVTLIQFISSVIDAQGKHTSPSIIKHAAASDFALQVTLIFSLFLCILDAHHTREDLNEFACVCGVAALNSCDDRGNVALHWAVERNMADSCRALLDLGADPNILNTALLSPLHLAVSLGHNNLVGVRKPRLENVHITNCNLEGDLGNTPLILACSINNCEALSILIKHRAQLCQQNKLGHFAMHAAAFAGAKKAMEVILKAGEENGHSAEKHINYLDKSNSSPLHLAVRGGNIEAIRLCIATGAKIDQQQVPNDRCTPLHLACTQGAIEVVKLMLSTVDQVEDVINLTDGACQTPLHRATVFDHAELAEFLISLGADLNSTDCKGNTPLLLATSCGAWKTVALLLSKGANVNMKDKCGCNFLHLAILQPKGLKNLPEEVLQCSNVKVLLSCEDNEGCTPLHYACRLGIHDSVKNMLGLSGQVGLACKSKDKKSALHFAAQYGRINTCHRLLETITDSRLLNEGDERGLTPLHLASRGGHTKVVHLLLRKGALFHSDYKGWTCLHHAASEGYTQTMDILLSSNIKLLDKTDEDGNTALHIAARAGHVAAVKMMLNRGAEMVLNKNHTSFLHEALQNGRKDVVNTVIDSDRCDEALSLFIQDSGQRCPILDMIEFLPETCKVFANAMVQYNRIELLNHPICKKYLAMKWIAYGSKAHLLNMFLYLLGLLPLTHLIMTLRPCTNTTVTGELDIIMVPISFTEVSARWNYFRDYSNQCDWTSAIFSLLFIIPLMLNAEGSLHWQAGAMAILNSWIGFLLYLQRFEGVGIYVVMFGEIMKTLVRIVMLFLYLMLAFSLAFHALMLNHKEFNSMPLSVIQTFVMMVGELNYQNNFLDAFLNYQLPFGILTYVIFVIFVLLMPILLVNLMIGLAVGDIAEVQRNASLKRIAMQIDLHTALEDKLPYWFMKRVDKPSITIYPNRKCSRSQTCSFIQVELTKQKSRMKEMSNILEKQHGLLKLIIQKMEITSEADEYDGPVNVRGSMWPSLSQAKARGGSTSRWVPLIKAIDQHHICLVPHNF
uniref:Transient receptor potential cation channel, subfamily A, member 1b n=1 Tax=Nothobranchius furzeri TaxID=105023 RepID=A0A8C6NTQ1_NOTFU